VRDLLVTFIIFSTLPVILFQPHVGILVWTWISLMNPHRLTWGFARTLPFAEYVGAATILAALNPAAPKRLQVTLETALLFLFAAWTLLTTSYALAPELAWNHWDKVSKILLMAFLTVTLITTRKQLDQFVWVTVLSVGYYGVKGGIFTIRTGGQHWVHGPDRSFIAGSNHLGAALIMIIPLMYYLRRRTERQWIRYALDVSMALTAVATLGTQSRGAMLGLAVMMGFLVLKGRKGWLAGFALLMMFLAFQLMPQKWFDRMDTIRTYEQDRSAMGRINAWHFAFNVAKDRPLGGGFNCFTRQWFAVYAPDPTDVHDSHSIYFEVLGEHGFVGLFIYLSLAGVTWRTCSNITRKAKKHEQTMWLSELARMLQVSMSGFVVTGAFVGLAYFDLYFVLVSITVVAKSILRDELAEQETVLESQWRGRVPLRTL
jgi:probable O-glycosylation ligase (exosortase A-associated)